MRVDDVPGDKLLQNFAYHAFGLRFRSQLELPYLEAAAHDDGDVDVKISLAPVARLSGPDIHRFHLWEARPDHFVISLPSVGRMEVKDGREICVDIEKNASRRDVLAHIQGSAFAALLQQRRILPLHAAAIETDKGALLIAGCSGIGKSTTANALIARDFRMMTDDVCGITFADDGAPLAIPGFPASRLWQDSARSLGFDIEELDPVREGMNKYYVPIRRYRSRPLAIHAIAIIGFTNGKDIVIRSPPASERVGLLVEQCFRKNFLAGLGLRDLQFQTVTRLAATARIASVERPRSSRTISPVADRIIDWFGLAPATDGIDR